MRSSVRKTQTFSQFFLFLSESDVFFIFQRCPIFSGGGQNKNINFIFIPNFRNFTAAGPENLIINLVWPHLFITMRVSKGFYRYRDLGLKRYRYRDFDNFFNVIVKRD